MTFNTIKTLTLEGVVQNSATNEFIPVALHRITAPLDLVSSRYYPRPSPEFALSVLESVPERRGSLLSKSTTPRSSSSRLIRVSCHICFKT
ncbi:hypothetical protein BV25DRAFT_1827634 [Artomyces pyxidatus]|uniref:Uncharacterized protein n=1 Tax=Artomyces pyxidatus TaxID=48021 RepID=A0ACB8SWA6_9AGAM|nr:hypothetical protein BV25DRAFT_1827634 [Artomyces pyxidatus]